MKTTLNTYGIVEKIMDLIEGNKKNAVVMSILTKSFLNGYAFETMVEMLSEKEMINIKNEINNYKNEYEVQNYFIDTTNIQIIKEEENIKEIDEKIEEEIKEEIKEEENIKEIDEKIEEEIKEENIKEIEEDIKEEDIKEIKFIIFEEVFDEKMIEI